jgi:hypothetical protein
MLVCARCGEKYHKGSSYSTDDHCGTCIFINGPLPEPKTDLPQLKYLNRTSVHPNKGLDIETLV